MKSKVKIELYNDHFEQWKDIKGYEGLYQVSNLGKVRSLDRIVKQFGHKQEYERSIKGKLLKLHIQNGGYLIATLTKNNNERKMLVHRLVAIAFMGNNEGMQVNHKDGNKLNNKLSNLEWCTQSENVKHAYFKLNHKLKNKKIYCVELNKKFNSIKEASISLKINRGSISHAINERAKTAGGYRWKIV